jgi:tetratricopeptide (TPR) repeat protein
MDGSFEQGLALIPELESKLTEYSLFIDNHRLLVFNYKIANLFFGSGKHAIAIDYLQRIININPDLRSDLQCYARLLHLMAHYELGNFDIMESLIRSVYRFMAKMQNLTVVEEEMFKFLRNSFLLSRTQLKLAFENFLVTLKKLENDRFQTRSFAYLDIISWVESKVYEKPLSQVIHDKYCSRRKRHYQ